MSEPVKTFRRTKPVEKVSILKRDGTDVKLYEECGEKFALVKISHYMRVYLDNEEHSEFIEDGMTSTDLIDYLIDNMDINEIGEDVIEEIKTENIVREKDNIKLEDIKGN